MEEENAGTERTNVSGLSEPEGPSATTTTTTNTSVANDHGHDDRRRPIRYCTGTTTTTTTTTTDEDVSLASSTSPLDANATSPRQPTLPPLSSPTRTPTPTAATDQDPSVRGCPVHSRVLERHESSRSTQSSKTSGSGTTHGSRDIQHETAVLHRHLPALKKYDLKTSTIRQHYYPEGGWGWLVCGCAFLVHILTTGMQLSYGILSIELLQHFGSQYVIQAGWLGALSMATSLFLAPFVVALCRRKSTRLTGVFGGLVMALACLFTSFAQQVHQTFISYGLLMGVGVGLVREAANLMVGQYFKRRREFIEIVVQAGSGIGMALFSVFFREAITSMGWRPGLQAVTGVLCSAFFLGVFYRSASLYHPQRRAILHIKNQKRKIKDKRGRAEDKPPYFDFATVKTKTLQIIMLSTSTAALGIYSPIFYLAPQCKEEGLDASSILLIQTFVGFGFAIGTVTFGLLVINERNEQCHIARQYLCQAALLGLALAILALATIRGYHSYVLFAWIYGSCLGGYHLTLKAFTYEAVRARHFPRAWAFVQWAKALPVLFGVPITGYMNNMHRDQSSSRSGFYLACVWALVGAACLFLLNLHWQRLHRRGQTVRFSNTVSHDGIRSTTSTSSSAAASASYAAAAVAAMADGHCGHYDHYDYDVDDIDGGNGDVHGIVGALPCDCQDHHDHRQRVAAAAAAAKSSSSLSQLNSFSSFGTSTSVDIPDARRTGDSLTCISEEERLAADYYVNADCIASCNRIENFLLFSEFDNHHLTGVDDTSPQSNFAPGQRTPRLCKQGICKHDNIITTYHMEDATEPHGDQQQEVVNGRSSDEDDDGDGDDGDGDDDDDDDEASDLVVPLPPPPPPPPPMLTNEVRCSRPILKSAERSSKPTIRNITVVEEMTTSV